MYFTFQGKIRSDTLSNHHTGDNITEPENSPLPDATHQIVGSFSSPEVWLGEPVEIAVELIPAPEGVWAYQSICSFDPALLVTPQLTLGMLFNPEIEVKQVYDDHVVFAAAQSHTDLPVTTSGLLATMTFTTQAEGAVSISCEVSLLDRERNLLGEPQVIYVESVVIVPAKTLGSISSEVIAGENLTNIPITVTVYDATTLTVVETVILTAGETAFTVDNLPLGAYVVVADADGLVAKRADVTLGDNAISILPPTILVPGDINGDALVEIDDLSSVAMNYLKASTLAPECDIDRSGLIDLPDLILIGASLRTTTPLSIGDGLPLAEAWSTTTP